MSNTNQIIHEQLMGKCWHRPDWFKKKISHLDNDTAAHGGKWLCVGCDQRFANYETEAQNPKYDSDLNLAFAAQAKAIERFGLDSFVVRLAEIVYKGRLPKIVGMEKVIGASAADRCAAIVKLLENEK